MRTSQIDVQKLDHLTPIRQLLLSTESAGMTMDELAAQVFIFFIAGFETSSTTMSFCLYELALNPDIERRVQDEIDNVLQKHDGEITYEAIQQMEYLDKTVAGKVGVLPEWSCDHDMTPVFPVCLSSLQDKSHTAINSEGDLSPDFHVTPYCRGTRGSAVG